MSDFREFAACRGVDPEAFFPLGRPGSPGFERLAAPARALCSGCPARQACLVAAFAEGDDVAIRGGFDPAQRRALRRFGGVNRRPAAALPRRAA